MTCDADAEDRLERAGKWALATAVQLWNERIVDPAQTAHDEDSERCRRRITELISGSQGLGWTWEGIYGGDKDFEWCGAFAAWCWGTWCWGMAGLDRGHRLYGWASTYRLDRWAQYKRVGEMANAPPAAEPRRRYLALDARSGPEAVAAFAPRAGDVLLVGDGRPAFGSHIALVERFDPAGYFETISGNGRGTLSDGRQGEGVVRKRFRLGRGNPKYFACRLIRPAPDDLADTHDQGPA